MDYIIFNKFKDLKLKNLKIGIPKEVSPGKIFSELRYFDSSDQRKKNIYLQSPEIMIGNLQWGAEDTEGRISAAFLDLYLLNISKSNSQTGEFKNFINNLDLYLCRKIWETRRYWKLNDKTPSLEIEKGYLPTLGLSSLGKMNRNCLRFKLGLKSYGKNNHYLEADIYDQENDELPLSLLKPEYRSKALILVKGILKEGNYYSLILELKQLKVKVPENVFDSCQLSDSEDDEPVSDIWEIYENEGGAENIEEY